jgi:hypothetical protein
MAEAATAEDYAVMDAWKKNKGDDTLWVRFLNHAVRNAEKSDKEGRLVCEDREYIQINAPGDKTTEIFREATDADKKRFPLHYAAFKERGSDAVVGTPLKDWAPITKGMVEELSFHKIKTVEQLAGITDGHLPQVGPGVRDLRQRAIDWLANAKQGAPVVELSSKLEESKNEVETLKRIVKEQGEQIELLKKKK